MTSNKNEDEILSISTKNIRQDLLHFKEEVLKDIKIVQREFANKFNGMENILKEQINIYESKVSSFEFRMKNISNLITSERSLFQKIQELVQFKDEANEKLIANSIKIANLETDYKGNINNIQSILSSSVIYPGIIGYSGRFNSFHDFMDYVLNEISDLTIFKEKNMLDLAPYKKKIDENLEYIKLQVDHIINSSNEFSIKKINDCEERLKSLIHLYDDRLQDTRVENAHYAIGLEKKSEELSNLIKNVYEAKADIYKKVKDEVSSVKGDQKALLRLYTSYKNEFSSFKDKFIQLSEFIRDVRFRVNIASDANKKDYIGMSKKLNFQNKGNLSFSRKKNSFFRAESCNLDKNNKNNDIFDSPNNTQTNYYPKTFGYNKRNSFQIQKFSNKLINKFDTSTNSKGSTNQKYNYNSSNRLIKTNNDLQNDLGDIFGSSEKQSHSIRRKTASVSLPNNFNTDFSQNILNSNIKTNNEIINPKKTKEENSLNSSNSSGDIIDKSKKNTEEKGKNENNLNKSGFTITEEDEYNMSEITEENKDQKSIKKKKSSKLEIKKKINLEKSIETIPKNENEENNKEKNKNKVELNKENEIENNKDKDKDNNNTNINKENVDKNIISGNNFNTNYKRTNNFNDKIINNNENDFKLQVNKNEQKQIENKKNHRLSIINMSDLFINRFNKPAPSLNSPANLYMALSQENKYIKNKPKSGNWKAKNNLSNPSLTYKSNKINSTANSREIVNSKNNLVNKKYIDTILDTEMKLGNPYKTYSSFPKLKLDGFDSKPKVNSKIIHLNNKKKKIDFTSDFLNRKITLNKEPITFKNFNSLTDK